MPGGRAPRDARRLAALAGALAVALGAACATIEAPMGGPEDRVAPRLVAAAPESGAVGQRDRRELTLTFSEKVDPRPAARFLRLYPPVEIAATHWEGRRTARVVFAAPLPRDTVIVVEVPPGLPDAHRVALRRGRYWAFATGDSLPRGEIAGALVQGGKAAGQGVVELVSARHDSLAWSRRPTLRRAETDSLGRFRLPWLPVPGGPWLLHAFVDRNGDRRAGEDEAQGLLPDTLRLVPGKARLSLASFTLFAPTDPGTVAGVIDSTPPWTAPLYGFVERVAETDSAWIARPLRQRPAGQRPVTRGQRTVWDKAGPGLVRLVVFADLDGDSLFSPAAVAPDTTRRWLEPHAVIDSLLVTPGQETVFRAIRFPATMTPWAGPPATDRAAAPDTARRR